LHGGLKRAVKQHLLLRGSRDFDSIEEYENFPGNIMDKRDQRRQERLTEELAVMKPLIKTPLVMWSEKKVPVSKGGLIRVLKNNYSLLTSLIGHKVTVRIHEWHLEVYYGSKLIETLPRLAGENRHHINYRHLIKLDKLPVPKVSRGEVTLQLYDSCTTSCGSTS
jgi:hypothetical protein